MKKLALVGYGKMGQLIEQLAPQHGFEVVVRLDEINSPNGAGITPERFSNVDVAIEFSVPEAAPIHLQRLAELKVSTVSGTTGWYAQLPEITRAVNENGTGLVWSPNFSIGVAIFRRLAALAAELMRNETAYGAWAWEIHHDAKKDSPSGTLIQLVDTMRKSGYQRNIDTSSSRAGKHPGTHEIGFDSAADTITLRHVARGREGFAHGALKSAEWILGRKGVFTFEQVLFGPEQTGN
jgi:4-hydroxy-tetrahydrodipicolinate reductase